MYSHNHTLGTVLSILCLFMSNFSNQIHFFNLTYNCYNSSVMHMQQDCNIIINKSIQPVIIFHKLCGLCFIINNKFEKNFSKISCGSQSNEQGPCNNNETNEHAIRRVLLSRLFPDRRGNCLRKTDRHMQIRRRSRLLRSGEVIERKAAPMLSCEKVLVVELIDALFKMLLRQRRSSTLSATGCMNGKRKYMSWATSL